MAKLLQIVFLILCNVQASFCIEKKDVIDLIADNAIGSNDFFSVASYISTYSCLDVVSKKQYVFTTNFYSEYTNIVSSPISYTNGYRFIIVRKEEMPDVLILPKKHTAVINEYPLSKEKIPDSKKHAMLYKMVLKSYYLLIGMKECRSFMCLLYHDESLEDLNMKSASLCPPCDGKYDLIKNK